jgi:ketosteroid isomerase-like protein
MADAGDILKGFYDAIGRRDMAKARTYLDDDLEFIGLFETYHGPEQYLTTFAGLLGITIRLEIKTIVSEGNQAAIFFELETKAPAEATTLVAEWHQVRNGKIFRVESAFDGRPFAAMFAGNT